MVKERQQCPSPVIMLAMCTGSIVSVLVAEHLLQFSERLRGEGGEVSSMRLYAMTLLINALPLFRVATSYSV
jgi:hypothetical protein